MNYWEALNKISCSNLGSYVIYTIVNNMRFSYVNQYDSVYRYTKNMYLKANKSNNGKSYSLSSSEKEYIKQNIKLSEAIFFQKEKFDPEKGWIICSKGTEPDYEFYHYILTAEWGIA